MRISRLVLLLTLTSIGFAAPVSAGQRGGHHPRPTVLPPLLHGGTPPRATPARPQHHATGHHRRPGGWAGGGHRRGEAVGYPMYGWPSTVLHQPARASRAARGVATPRFEAIVLAPGMGPQAGRPASPRRPQRIVPGYYDTPRPMAKIIHVGRKVKH